MNRVLLSTTVLRVFFITGCAPEYTTPKVPYVAEAIPNVQEVETGPARTPGQFDPTNLQALPKTWSSDQVTDYMGMIASSLGVKCDHCHVGGEPESDAKPMKLAARKMITMTRGLDKLYMKDFASKVTCNTCHKGNPTPK